MNSLLRRISPARAAWVCRRCYTTAVDPANSALGEAKPTGVVGPPARTRFAPSPTGFLHLGGLRTALYNYLLAKKTGGQFILRIEDTDQKRTVPNAEESIMETLRWAGLQWDEGPQVGGEYGPYRQSERSELHRAHAHTLLENGHAYRCFCGPKRLEALAQKRRGSSMPVEYDRRCHNLSHAESDERAAKGESHVIRLLAPEGYPPFIDAVYGPIKYGENTQAHAAGSFEDPILLKSDGMPTYHLANVVDDHHMEITHVLRAAEWMPSTPKHMHLYGCFGWKPPQWVHVGLLTDKTHSKLSKRDGSVMVNEYREEGYTADALNNFVALLGWSHGGAGRSDVMTLEDLVEAFNIDGLTQGNTIVNFEKLDYLQKNHVRRSVETGDGGGEELNKVEKIISEKYGDKIETGTSITRDYIRQILHANVQNYTTPAKFAEISYYFFKPPIHNSGPALGSIKNLLKFFKQSGCSVAELWHGFIEEVEKIPDTPKKWTVENLKNAVLFEQELDEEAWKTRMRLLRLAVTGGASGPHLADTMWVLGKERTLERIRGVDKAFEHSIVVKEGTLVVGEKIQKAEERVAEKTIEGRDDKMEWKAGGKEVDKADERELKKWEKKIAGKKVEKKRGGRGQGGYRSRP